MSKLNTTITISIAFLLLLYSCSSSSSIDSFYNAHKDDSQVLAIRVPEVMIGLIAGISPEMNDIIGNANDIRYMRFSNLSSSRIQSLNNQMNRMTTNSFIEVYRKNNELQRNVVSIREKRNVVKEILVYNNNNINASFLYFNGAFDPSKVKSLAEDEKFKVISEGLFQQFNANTLSE